MDEPTRGIDIGAKRDIYDLMNELTNDGVHYHGVPLSYLKC